MKGTRRLTWELALLAVITLLAAYLRLHRIDSLPPGDGYDPAVYGLDALEILSGARPVYLPTNFGREALFSYLVACCIALLGVGPQAIYTASAITGVLTVPAVYFVAREFFAAEGSSGGKKTSQEDHHQVLVRWGGLLAALATAVSYWHQSWSRLGVRAILVPLFAALTMGFFLRGQRTQKRWVFVACGVSLGLSAYTYQVARLFPLLVLLGFVYAAWPRLANAHSPLERRRTIRRDLLNLALVVLTALIVFGPLGIYFVTHPGAATVRIEQTLAVDLAQGLGSAARTMWEQGTETLSALFLRGGDWPKVNPPGRAALNPFLALAFLLGLVVSLARIRRPYSLLMLTWLALMIAPALLAHRGPTTKRAIGMLPAVMVLIAVGCLAPWQAARRWAIRHRPAWTRGLSAGLAIVIGAGFLGSAIGTYRDYFGRWAQDPSLFTHFEAGLSATGRYIGQRPPQERIYLSSVSHEHPSVLYNSQRRPNVKGYNGRVCLVLADGATHEVSYVIVPAEDKEGLALLLRYLPLGRVADEGPLHYEQPYFVAYRVPAGTRAQVAPAHQQAVNWGDKVQLLGYDLEKASYQPGETIQVTVYYGVTDEIEANYTVFVHLLGPDNPATGGPLWAQDDSEPCRRSYPTSTWETDEIVVDRYAVTIPPEAPAGEYQLAMGLYEWQTLQRLPVLDDSGGVAGDHTILARVNVGSGD